MTRMRARLRRAIAAWWDAVYDVYTEHRARRVQLRRLERIFG